MKTALLALLLFYATLITTAQERPAGHIVTGKVADSLKGVPLPYATIIVQDSLTRKNVKSTGSSTDGTFEISGLPAGSYRLSVASIGYKSSTRNFSVSAAHSSVSLGAVSLIALNNALKEVVITAQKPLIEQTDDKIIYNAENDPSSKTSSAIDVLRKTPFITVDGDNNIQINGQSNFRILLNGKETAMFARNVKEALQAFPGSLIVKIEVITNPSAKYDAEGVGGVINIVTSKKIAGYNGSLYTTYNTRKQAAGSGTFNGKSGKFNFAGSAYLSSNDPLKSTLISETTPFVPAVYSKRTLTGVRSSEYNSSYGALEVNYEADSLSVISAYVTLNGFSSTGINRQDVVTRLTSGDVSSRLDQRTDTKGPLSSFGMDFSRTAKKNKEQEFSFRLNAQLGNTDQVIGGDQLNQASRRYSRNTSAAENKEYTVQSDYVLPFKNKTKLETGLKAIFRVAATDYRSLISYDDMNYSPDLANSDNFDYNQQVYSAYGSFSFKIKKFDFRMGVRAENTNVNGNFRQSNTEVRQRYSNVAPNLQISRKWSNVLTTVLSYNLRLQRPSITSLNPFVNNSDTLNISYGNPNLSAQTYHTVSLQARVLKGRTFAGFTLSASQSSNIITQFAVFQPQTGVTTTTSGNIGKETQLILNANLSTTIGSLNMFVNGMLRYNHIQNKLDALTSREGLSGSAYTGGTWKVTSRFNLSGSGGISQSAYTVLGKGTLYVNYQVNAGLVIFKDKLNANVNFNNFLYPTVTNKSYAENSNFRTVNTAINPARITFFGLTYKFGRLKENTSKAKGVKNDDLLQ
jgi:hypothetical protein